VLFLEVLNLLKHLLILSHLSEIPSIGFCEVCHDFVVFVGHLVVSLLPLFTLFVLLVKQLLLLHLELFLLVLQLLQLVFKLSDFYLA